MELCRFATLELCNIGALKLGHWLAAIDSARKSASQSASGPASQPPSQSVKVADFLSPDPIWDPKTLHFTATFTFLNHFQ